MTGVTPAPYIGVFDQALKSFFWDAMKLALKRPGLLPFMFDTFLKQRSASRIRRNWQQKGLLVPPVMIVSITDKCNLNCKGCYAIALARSFHRSSEQEMSSDRLRSIIKEAKDLGVSVMLIAGGEPLARGDILDITRAFPDIVFPMFTNGMLIDDALIARLLRQRNLVPVLSLEGYADDTDSRRGQGVYANLRHLMKKMTHKGLFLGCSLTVTRANFDLVIEELFLKELVESGVSLFFFVEYVPIAADTEDLLLTEQQRSRLRLVTKTLDRRFPSLFVSFPGDEEDYGGCLSAGRGFLHVSPAGNLEPCPFAPFSDVNLIDFPLKEALASPFLRSIRENHEKLKETTGGCALWANRQWVASLLGKEQDPPPISGRAS